MQPRFRNGRRSRLRGPLDRTGGRRGDASRL
eukprot:CAMPEP_0179153002 /NCGR_PEP_ID=MMETSP0796-20121207/74379_1 /TAXON_ID=73915 /ORGANISM="Pyrodinium bahamense, Strain pbaha01" /LENGTH=30 /DNA_ID= /DNA_START= /DNA_END= /DNA_ORIENTATION=